MEDCLVAESVLKYLLERVTSLPQTIFHLAAEKAENHHPNWKSLTDNEQNEVNVHSTK